MDIYLIFDFEEKVLEFFELNSAIKGFGQKMVGAVLENIPPNWKSSVMFNYNPDFWDKIQKLYPNVKWLEL